LSQKYTSSSKVIIGYAVTPVHVGAGRSPGVVDLPLARDPVGFPVIYGSSIKGVLKSELIRRNGIDEAVCLFGYEPGEEKAKEEGEFKSFAGMLNLTDFIPLFYPIASLNKGYVYITSRYLASRVEDLISYSLGKEFEFKITEVNGSEKVDILRNKLNNLKRVQVKETEIPFIELGNLFKDRAEDSVYLIEDDSIGLQFIESSLVRITRNKLNRETKTVDKGALWTEEYYPAGTVFSGAITNTGRKTLDKCKGIQDPFQELLNKFGGSEKGGFYVFVGGKETVGKGLMFMKIFQMG